MKKFLAKVRLWMRWYKFTYRMTRKDTGFARIKVLGYCFYIFVFVRVMRFFHEKK